MAPGMLGGRRAGNYVVELFGKVDVWISFTNLNLPGIFFPTYFGVIPCCMQKLSSIHRLGQKFERDQGFHGRGGKFENHEIC